MPLVVTLVGTHTIATATDSIKRRRAGTMLLSHAKVKIAGSLVYPPWQMKSCSLTCLKVVSLGSSSVQCFLKGFVVLFCAAL